MYITRVLNGVLIFLIDPTNDDSLKYCHGTDTLLFMLCLFLHRKQSGTLFQSVTSDIQ